LQHCQKGFEIAKEIAGRAHKKVVNALSQFAKQYKEDILKLRFTIVIHFPLIYLN
jgi:hypothetical protein